ncbi:MAG: hypothetical protein F6J96_10160 [Symploca sp. SIO1C2]|nr:hypothetical protein [Symploca sp. SIO1C2]
MRNIIGQVDTPRVNGNGSFGRWGAEEDGELRKMGRWGAGELGEEIYYIILGMPRHSIKSKI